MTTRTDEIRKALQPHLPLFSASHQALLSELLHLAQVGERAQSLISSFSLSSPAKSADAAPKRRGPGRPPKAAAAPAAKPAAKEAKPAKGGRARASGGPSLADMLTKVLQDAGKPLSIPDLANAVKAAGYASGSAKFSVVVGNVVAKLPGVKRVGRGLYAKS